MRCAWKELLAVLPNWLRQETDRLGKETLQEIRMRTGKPVEFVLSGKSMFLKRDAVNDDISFVINTASRYSPWSATSLANGYLTAPGGHRIGVCGEAVCENGMMIGIRYPSALCIRVARDFPGIGQALRENNGSILIAGSPGSGKTTLLRDLIRQRSNGVEGSVGVVDERGELFPGGIFDTGRKTDVITGCSKSQGIYCLLRAMGPGWIAVDEVTQTDDCNAVLEAGRCGVKILATAHAYRLEDLYDRGIYRKLLESGIFGTVLVMQPDKSFRTERVRGCTQRLLAQV